MSKKLLLSLCVTYILTSGLVFAQTGSAVFIDYASCGMLNENGDDLIFGDGVEIIANSANGNVTLVCSVKLERDLELSRSVIWNYDNTNGGLCGTSLGPTEDWHQIITPSGNAKVTCHYRE